MRKAKGASIKRNAYGRANVRSQVLGLARQTLFENR
jgi:hypothetical protein